jgi:prepilin-type N-terminal cleavage/methylation domain-containing protein
VSRVLSWRHRLAGERGLSLIEVLVTVAILGLAFVTILGGMTVSIAGSDVHRKQATSQTVLRNLAEYLKSVPYQGDCPADYSADLQAFTRQFDAPRLRPDPLPPGYVAPGQDEPREVFEVRIVDKVDEEGEKMLDAEGRTIDDVGYGRYFEDPAGPITVSFSDGCDDGPSLQKLTLEVRSLVLSELAPESLDVVKRRD